MCWQVGNRYKVKATGRVGKMLRFTEDGIVLRLGRGIVKRYKMGEVGCVEHYPGSPQGEWRA